MSSCAQATSAEQRTNWSGNYVFQAPLVLEPATVAEVQEAVRSVDHVRALGTRHSFNGIADSRVAQISTSRMRDVVIDADAGTVRVGAGVRYGNLALQLDAAGWALHNMASLPHISVGGAVSTGTHGSGPGNGNLATAVNAIELVLADGSVQQISRERDGKRFPGAVVAMGALGIMTHLTLALQPSFAMTQIVYEGLPFDVLEHHLAEVMGAGYSVSLFTDWQNGRVNQVWIKQRVQPGEVTEPAAEFFGATPAKTKLHPLTGQPAEACTDQDHTAGPWYERMPHFRLDFQPSRGDELQSEYFVPMDQGYAAIRAVEQLRDRLAPLLYVTEFRAIAADDLWMSGQFERPSLGIHFTWRLAWDEVLAVLPDIEAALAPFAARPHWGKVFTMRGERIAPLYPKAEEFKRLVAELDPTQKFGNEYLKSVLP